MEPVGGFSVFLNTNWLKQRSCLECTTFAGSRKNHVLKLIFVFLEIFHKQRHPEKVFKIFFVFIFENPTDLWLKQSTFSENLEIHFFVASWVWIKNKFSRHWSHIFCRGYEIVLFCRGWMVRNQRNRHQRVSINSTISEHFWKKVRLLALLFLRGLAISARSHDGLQIKQNFHHTMF